jgi:hypothetical protein
MLQGVCVDSGQSAVLEKGTSYYLFPNGSKHFYVSKLPNASAHKGCFQAKYFQVIDKELWPEEPEIVAHALDTEKVYKANLIWRKPGYRSTELKTYYVQPKMTHGYFYHDSNLKRCGGCFPLHWFSDFQEYDLDIIDQEVPEFDIDFEETVPILVESDPNLSNYEQLSLFDF